MKKIFSKLTKQDIFILINIVILIFIICFYAIRLVHFYIIEHPKVSKKITLNEVITLKKNITYVGDGLYKEDDNYIFKGKNVNNYLEYSGYLFRIISVDKDGNIKLITDDSITTLAWGLDNTYENSYIKSWLLGEEEHAGVFYKSLNNPDNYLVETKFCTEVLDEKNKECKSYETSKVGLLSLEEYKNAQGIKSYLNKDNFWWLGSSSENGVWHVYSNGKINDSYFLGNELYSYGVRPVITIKGSVSLISGDGTYENPYIIEKETSNTLKYKNVGKYVKYSNLNWRIIEKNDGYIRLALDGYIKENDNDLNVRYSDNTNIYSSNNDIGYYLNTIFYAYLDPTYMVSGPVYTNMYDNTTKFNYLNIFDDEVELKVGMMQVGDLYLNDYNDYYLVSRTSDYMGTIYKVVDGNRIYADLPTNESKIRPTIFLDLSSPIKSGSGSKLDPYVIG